MNKTLMSAAGLAVVGIIILVVVGLRSPAAMRQGTQAGPERLAKATEYQVDQSDLVNAADLKGGADAATLTDKEKAGLIQMREEEKLAHDVYVTLGAKWDAQVFTNVAQSEQKHTEAIKTLLDRYGVADPAAGKGVGEFTAPTMQKLYTDLVSQGNASLVTALTVGATVEDLDIRDLDVLKKDTTKEDILFVYNNLQKGSRNHTRGYVRNLQAQGSSYTPQFISQADFDAILNSPQERGPQI